MSQAPDHPHSHERSQRGSYTDLVDELFRMNLIDKEKRDFLREGLRAAAGQPFAPPSVTQPTSAHVRLSEAGAKRAADAGLVEMLGPGRYR